MHPYSHRSHLRASVLATVLVAASLMLLATLGILSLWDADFRLFSRLLYERNQRANLESAFLLWQHLPEPESSLDEDNALQLYDSLPLSRIFLKQTPWGLYEVVCATNHDRRQWMVRLMGADRPWRESCLFFYPNQNFSFTLTGKSFLKGAAQLPKTGIQYGQFESRFFEGEKLPPQQVGLSADGLPPPLPASRALVDSLFALRLGEEGESLTTDSLVESFYDRAPRLIRLGSGLLTDCILRGNLILLADELHIDPSCSLENILIVARSLTLQRGFRGVLQAFVTDSIHVGEQVILKYPSGLFLQETGEKKRITLSAGSEVNGYVIVDSRQTKAKGRPTVLHYTQEPTSIVRGLLYVNGTAQWQGLVSGSAFLNKTLHISPFGRYEDFALNVTALENRAFGYPFWLEAPPEKKEIAWVN